MSRSDDGNQRTIITPAHLFRKKKKKQNHHKATSLSQIDHYGLLGFCFFRRVDFVWLLMSNSELLRIKNGQKTPYKKQKTASSHKKK